MSASPPRLYKYESFTEQSLRNLKNRSIYLSSPDNFNDPYDCALFPVISTPSITDAVEMRELYIDRLRNEAQVKTVRDKQATDLPGFFAGAIKMAMDELRDTFSKQGISCFSEVNDELLMWSHYAGKHTGFCLEFDAKYAPFNSAKAVNYREHMPYVDASKLLIEKNYEEVLDLFSTKSTSWKYEREWRIRSSSQMNECLTYPAEALTGIYFGPRTSRDVMDIVYLIIQGTTPACKFWQGRISKTAFKVEFDAYHP